MPHEPHGLAGWLERARRLVPAEDRKVLLSPPRLAARFVKFAIRRDIAQATQGRDAAYLMVIERQNQVTQALGQLEKAKELLDSRERNRQVAANQ